jgi:hypothetical protein
MEPILADFQNALVRFGTKWFSQFHRFFGETGAMKLELSASCRIISRTVLSPL